MTDTRAAEAAGHIWTAWRAGARLGALPDGCRPRTLEEGYAAQDALAAHAGAAYGWKIAATSAEGRRHIGVTAPLAGRLFARFALADGAAVAAAGLHMAVAEPEFAFRFARAIPPGPERTVADVLGAVDALHLAIEVPDTRFDDFANAGAPQLLADDACAGYFVLGPRVEGWRGVDLPSAPVAIGDDAGHVHEGSGANALGDPRLALAWLVNDRARRGIAIAAGDVVTTGTCARPLPIAPGRVVTARFGVLGAVTVRFT